MVKFSLKDRVTACVQAVAVGDAMGKMTEGFWPEEILSTYGGQVTCYQYPLHPRGPEKGRRQERWGYAEVTDDTRFTLLIAESIIDKRSVDRQEIIRRILSDKTRIKGWPGWDGFSRAAQLGEDEIAEFAEWRDGNGAPMRVSAIGIINNPKNLGKIIRDVDSACSMTHGARSALSGACAIAAAISAAVEGYEKEDVFESSVKAARLGESLGNDDARPLPDRVLIGTDFADDYKGSQLPRDLRSVLNPGFKAYEGVPYALSLAYGIQSAKDVILGAVNEGGDADSIASMAGSIASALYPDTLPQEWVRQVEKINNLDLSEVALKLAEFHP
jgi:ADP-ribosylglycohydrolase